MTVTDIPPHPHVVVQHHGAWFACAYPERPHDANTVWLYECDACTLALIAAANATPNMHTVTCDNDGQVIVEKHGLAGGVERALTWRDTNGYRPL